MIAQSKLRTRILILALFAIFCFSDHLVFVLQYGFDLRLWSSFLRYNIIGISLRLVSAILMVYPLIKEKLRWLTLVSVALLAVSLYCSPFSYTTFAYDLPKMHAFLALIFLVALMACVLIKPSEKRGCFAAKIWFLPAAIQTLLLVYLFYRSFIETNYGYRTLYDRYEEAVLFPFIANIVLTAFFYIFSRWLVSPYKKLLDDRKNCATIQKKERKMKFDEKSPKWLRIFKGYTMTMYCLDLLAAVVLGIMGWADVLYWIEPFIDGIICFAGGIFIAFSGLVVNMLILQFLNNVQIIREELEKK